MLCLYGALETNNSVLVKVRSQVPVPLSVKSDAVMFLETFITQKKFKKTYARDAGKMLNESQFGQGD